MKVCESCGSVWDDAAKICGNCGTSLAEPENASASVPFDPMMPVPAPGKKGIGKKLIAIIAAAAVLVGVVVTGFVTNWFGIASTPLEDLKDAVVEDLESGGFTIEYSYKRIRDGEERSSNTEKYTLVLDRDEETFAVYAEHDNAEFLMTQDGQWEIHRYDDGSIGAWQGDIDNDMVDMFIKAYDAVVDGDTTLWGEAAGEWCDFLFADDIIDTKKAAEFLAEFESTYLSDEAWLEENFGFEKSQSGGATTYTFAANAKEAAKILLELIEDTDVMDEDAFEELESELKYISKIDLELEIEIEDGMLVGVEFTMEEDETQYIYSFEISDIGEAEVSEDDIEEIQEIVEDYINDHTCPDCGEIMSSDYTCWNCDAYYY